MQVSFIIPLYNCLPLTQAMVASLRATLPRDLACEIILVDDGSTDGTRVWLNTLAAPFRPVFNERNLGYAAANNRGAEIAQGEFLALLNNDLVLTPHWLEPMLALHRQLGDRAGLIGNVQRSVRTGAVDHAGIFINAKGKPEHERLLPGWSWLPGAWRRADAVTGACVLVRREFWRRLQGFDERYQNGCEDVDLCLRAAALGHVQAVALRSVVQHHISASPGRTRRNEENTHRLVLQWRETLVRLGARHWAEDHLAALQAGDLSLPELMRAWPILGGALPFSRHSTAAARAGLDAAIEREMERWRQMFGPL